MADETNSNTITVKLPCEENQEVDTLRVRAGVRYWEDATVNDEEDEDGALIPLRCGDSWCPVIELERGVIRDWPTGTVADIHYKICDDGDYYLERNGEVVAQRLDEYVPDVLSPGGSGYGDYVIMSVDGAGRILNWDVSALANDKWRKVAS